MVLMMPSWLCICVILSHPFPFCISLLIPSNFVKAINLIDWFGYERREARLHGMNPMYKCRCVIQANEELHLCWKEQKIWERKKRFFKVGGNPPGLYGLLGGGGGRGAAKMGTSAGCVHLQEPLDEPRENVGKRYFTLSKIHLSYSRIVCMLDTDSTFHIYTRYVWSRGYPFACCWKGLN